VREGIIMGNKHDLISGAEAQAWKRELNVKLADADAARSALEQYCFLEQVRDLYSGGVGKVKAKVIVSCDGENERVLEFSTNLSYSQDMSDFWQAGMELMEKRLKAVLARIDLDSD